MIEALEQNYRDEHASDIISLHDRLDHITSLLRAAVLESRGLKPRSKLIEAYYSTLLAKRIANHLASRM